MTDKIDVLDHGLVRLVDSMGSDLSISRAARISYDAAPREEDAKLIHYLYKNRHTTPFEAVTATFEIKCPIFVTRQWHRHRTQSYNEVSARYKELPSEFYIPETFGQQHSDNKQMRTEDKNPNNEILKKLLEQNSEMSYANYQTMIELGAPRELARSTLPVNIYTHFFTTMNLHNLFHFLRLRLHEHAQYEIRVYAEAMVELMKPIVPIAMEAFMLSLKD